GDMPPGDAPISARRFERRMNCGEVANPYGSAFWFCYLANTALMIAVSILFRYADFVIGYLGGTEQDLGLIVGIGMIGAILMRVVQGVGIDHYGPRTVWLICLLLFIASTGWHLLIGSVDGPSIYLARALFATSVAGCFGASLTYISLKVPPQRVAEMVGTLGTSGCVGLAIGPAIGDLFFSSETITRGEINRMFVAAAVMGCVSFVCAAAATRGQTRRERRRRPPLLAVVRRYHPGVVLLVAAAMGLGVGLPHVFLKSYVDDLDIPRIRTFFWIYAATAFLVRIRTRRITEQLGFRPVILMGLGSLAASMLAYMPVQSEWQLVFPALFAGVAHAFLFPAVVAAGGARFPVRYRGVATTLTLALFDVGNCFGQPLVGTMIVTSRRLELPSYPLMFATVAATMLSVAGFYAWRTSPALVAQRQSRRAARRAGATV
ncbi:MAG: MFS transporter, partial [Planctomycetales bacterium]|nr:MFS transporter [Planctomycetales bacterium]